MVSRTKVISLGDFMLSLMTVFVFRSLGLMSTTVRNWSDAPRSQGTVAILWSLVARSFVLFFPPANQLIANTGCIMLLSLPFGL